MKVKSERAVALSCPTLRNPVDFSLPGFSVHGVFQARVLEWVAIAFSVVNKWTREQNRIEILVFFIQGLIPKENKHFNCFESLRDATWEKAMAPHSSTLA